MGQKRERHGMRKMMVRSYEFHEMTNDSLLIQSTAGAEGEEDAGDH